MWPPERANSNWKRSCRMGFLHTWDSFKLRWVISASTLLHIGHLGLCVWRPTLQRRIALITRRTCEIQTRRGKPPMSAHSGWGFSYKTRSKDISKARTCHKQGWRSLAITFGDTVTFARLHERSVGSVDVHERHQRYCFSYSWHSAPPTWSRHFGPYRPNSSGANL